MDAKTGANLWLTFLDQELISYPRIATHLVVFVVRLSLTGATCSSVDGVGFSIWRQNFNMVAMTSFHAEKCCHLVSQHDASVRRLCSSVGVRQFLIYSTFQSFIQAPFGGKLPLKLRNFPPQEVLARSITANSVKNPVIAVIKRAAVIQVQA